MNRPDLRTVVRYFLGLLINGKDEAMRRAIHRLCIRGEGRIDLDSLKRKFDA